MDHEAQAKSSVAEIREGVLDDQARRAYAVAFGEKTDTTGGLGTMEAALQGAKFFDVVVNGETVARYALQSFAKPGGVEVCIVGAAGSIKGFDLTASILPSIERQCQTADRLKVNTRRRGLVRKLLKQGWQLDCYVLGKKPHVE